jgi:hypothetical protein
MKKISLLIMLALVAVSCEKMNDSLNSDGKTAPVTGEVLITEITSTGATFTSSVESYGSYSVIERGFSYGVESKPYETGSAVAATETSGNKFTAHVNNLKPKTTYYVTPYLQVGESKYYVGTEQEVCFTTKIQGDYSSAKVESDNRNVEIHLRGCFRNGNRVKIEATILNTGINAYDNYYLYGNNYGYKIGSYTFNSHVEDDAFTSYGNYAVTVDLNTKSNNTGFYTQLPIGATKILTVMVDGVPTNAKKISLYLATEFKSTTPTEYAYLTFENMPIY